MRDTIKRVSPTIYTFSGGVGDGGGFLTYPPKFPVRLCVFRPCARESNREKREGDEGRGCDAEQISKRAGHDDVANFSDQSCVAVGHTCAM